MNLPDCPDIENELIEIRDNFGQLVKKFSNGDKVKLGDGMGYDSDFFLCTEAGTLKEEPGYSVMVFHFSPFQYEGEKDDFKRFFEKLFNNLCAVFGGDFIYNTTVDTDDCKAYDFFEKDKEVWTSQRRISLSIFYKSMYGLAANHVSLDFEHYSNR